MTVLTAAQEDALDVLRKMDGKPVGAWKKSTVYEDGPYKLTRINNVSAANLCRKKLARRIWGSFNAFAATDTFVITDDGRRWGA